MCIHPNCRDRGSENSEKKRGRHTYLEPPNVGYSGTVEDGMQPGSNVDGSVVGISVCGLPICALWKRTSSSTFSLCFLDIRPNLTAMEKGETRKTTIG